MSETFAATFSGPDMSELTRALIAAAPYARGTPTGMRKGFSKLTPAADWEASLVGGAIDGLSVDWGRGRRIARNQGAISADLPDVPLDPAAVLEHLAPLPFEIAVLPMIHDWLELDYHAPAIGADHALLGWGIVVKGDGHRNSVVSRRWLEHGPWRVVRGAGDTTLCQFHDLGADAATALAQATPAHAWLVDGFLRRPHRYTHDIQGVYLADDRVLRVIVNGRAVDDAELVDACAARRDRRDDGARPIDNIAYVFVERAEAEARLEALWLRELECRTVDGGAEVRLDADHRRPRRAPGWAEGA